MKAQLAEASERIKTLSTGLIEKRGGSCKFHTLEELLNIKGKVQREIEVIMLQQERRGILEEQRRQPEKEQVHCSTSGSVV